MFNKKKNVLCPIRRDLISVALLSTIQSLDDSITGCRCRCANGEGTEGAINNRKDGSPGTLLSISHLASEE